MHASHENIDAMHACGVNSETHAIIYNTLIAFIAMWDNDLN